MPHLSPTDAAKISDYALAELIVRTLDAAQSNIIPFGGCDIAGMEEIHANYQKLKLTTNFQSAHNQSRADWVAKQIAARVKAVVDAKNIIGRWDQA